MMSNDAPTLRSRWRRQYMLSELPRVCDHLDRATCPNCNKALVGATAGVWTTYRCPCGFAADLNSSAASLRDFFESALLSVGPDAGSSSQRGPS